MLAVARVDDVSAGVAGDELRRSDLRVADHDHVGVVGPERQGRVFERLALVDGRACRLDRHRVRGEPFRGELEARRRARRGLVEDVDDRLAAQRRQLFQLPLERPLEVARGAKQPLDVLAFEVADRDQVPARRLSGREQVLPHDADFSHSGFPPRRPG